MRQESAAIARAKRIDNPSFNRPPAAIRRSTYLSQPRIGPHYRFSTCEVRSEKWGVRDASRLSNRQLPSTLTPCASPPAASSATLRAIVEEFVTRDGTDHSSVERRIKKVLLQLNAGQAELYFDGKTQTCNIRPMVENPSAGGRDK